MSALREIQKRLPNREFESLTQVPFPGGTCRVWRTESTWEAACNPDNADIRQVVWEHRFNVEALGLALEELPRVAAIAITDPAWKRGYALPGLEVALDGKGGANQVGGRKPWRGAIRRLTLALNGTAGPTFAGSRGEANEPGNPEARSTRLITLGARFAFGRLT